MTKPSAPSDNGGNVDIEKSDDMINKMIEEASHACNSTDGWAKL